MITAWNSRWIWLVFPKCGTSLLWPWKSPFACLRCSWAEWPGTRRGWQPMTRGSWLWDGGCQPCNRPWRCTKTVGSNKLLSPDVAKDKRFASNSECGNVKWHIRNWTVSAINRFSSIRLSSIISKECVNCFEFMWQFKFVIDGKSQRTHSELKCVAILKLFFCQIR